jgi:hypothetical protein
MTRRDAQRQRQTIPPRIATCASWEHRRRITCAIRQGAENLAPHDSGAPCVGHCIPYAPYGIFE